MASDIDVYIRLLNARRFQSALSTSAAGVRNFTGEVEAAGEATGIWATASKGATGALYALGAASRTAMFIVGAAASVALVSGLQFNATMQSNTLAFEKFIGSGKKADVFVKKLFDIAAAGPFEFDSITTAARRLLAFGFTAKDTIKQVNLLSDAMAYIGGGPDVIMRTVKAIGEIQSKGKLYSRQLLQLTTAGIGGKGQGFMAALQKKLHLSKKDMEDIGKANISSARAITAIDEILQETYGGGAAKYSKTWTGELNRIKDYSKRAMGSLTKPLFTALTANGGLLQKLGTWFKNLNKYFDSASWKKTSKQIFDWIGGALHVVVAYVQEFFKAWKPAMPFFKNVLLPLLAGIAVALLGGIVAGFKLLILTIRIIAPILGWIGKVLKPFKAAFFAIGYVIGFFLGPVILKAIRWLTDFGGIFRLIGSIASVITIPFKLFYGATELVARGIFRAGAFIGEHFLGAINKVFPALGRLISGFVKFGQAIRSKLVNAFIGVFNFLGKLSGKFISAGAKIGDALFLGIKRKIIQAFTGMVGIAASIGGGIRKWLNANTLFGDNISLGPLGHVHIPALAQGGYISSGGMALVGERGPELVNLPTGASVVPSAARVGARPGNAATTPSATPFSGLRVAVHSPIYLDKRMIGEAMGEYIADRGARR